MPPANANPSHPGDPPGSWRDAMDNLRGPDGRPINPDGSVQTSNGIKTPFGNTNNMPDPGAESESAKRQREMLEQQGAAASGFAGVGEQGYGATGIEAQQARDYLRRVANGQDSLSREQLRQGLQQQLAMQRSYAASAPPSNQAMAARTAANNMGRASSGMSGNAAMAGIQERNAANLALNDAILKQRQQDMQVALDSRRNAISGYGGAAPEKSWIEKYGGAIAGGAAAMSDERLKEDIKGGDSAAKRALEGLRAYTYRYKDEKHGKGKQFGPMAQDLERAGLKHAVIDTPDGKAVHGAKAALSSLALVAALGRRVSKLEGKRK